MTVEEIVAENDTVVARVRVMDTHQGEFWGVAAIYNSINVREIFMIKVVNSQVVEARALLDLYLLFKQLNQN